MKTLALLNRTLNTEWKDVALGEAFEHIRRETGVDMAVMWVDEDNPAVGLRQDRKISLTAKSVHAIDLLEKVLERADTRPTGEGSTWQISDTGTLQVGPRERLNKWVRSYAYDVADVLMPIYDWLHPSDPLLADGWMRTPDMLKKRADAGFEDARPVDERAESLRVVITQMCEPKAWVDNGGDAATIIYERGSRAFVVRAPDYVHRAIDGYHHSPSRVIAPETIARVPGAPAAPAAPTRQ